MSEETDDTDVERSTAPQSPYSQRQVAVGFLVLAVGLLATYGLVFLLGA